MKGINHRNVLMICLPRYLMKQLCATSFGMPVIPFVIFSYISEKIYTNGFSILVCAKPIVSQYNVLSWRNNCIHNAVWEANLVFIEFLNKD